MTNLVLYRESTAITLPEPRVPGGISIRVATSGGDDLKFIDGLQKKHSKMVGFLKRDALVGHFEKGNVQIAEECHSRAGGNPVGGESTAGPLDGRRGDHDGAATPLGYCIFQDKYDKHDDCGIFYQVNILPGRQRGLIGAALVKAALDRAAYGCKLACCWCAQDLEANYFWESLGFVPLAFRTGSRPRMKKDGTVSKPERIHILWQRRIREGDESTPYWFPAETNNGAVREARIVLPIPPGTHWSDAKPAVLPSSPLPLGEGLGVRACSDQLTVSAHPHPSPLPEGEGIKRKRAPKPKPDAVMSRPPSRGAWVAPPKPPEPTPEEIKAAKKAAKAKERAERPRPPKFKNDPKLVAAAREFRDRYIEQINEGLLLPPSACGKYDVSRQLASPVAPPIAPLILKQTPPPHLLQAA